jgi:hypothetical protein
LEQKMNGIEYTPQKGDSPFAPQTGSQADFSYSMSPDVIAIVDLDFGHRPVTNDIENALCKIEYYHQAPITAFKIMYRDSEGVWERSRLGRSTGFLFRVARDRRERSTT